MKTLLVLPNAIGDVVCGLGVARHFAAQGELTWIANESASDIVDGMACRRITPPSDRLRRRAAFGAPTETLWRATENFLETLRREGPFDLVLNPHLSRPASLMAGAVDGRDHRGPALGARVFSDPWSDFIMGSIHHGVAPEHSAVARFSLIAGMANPARPELARGDGSGPIVFVPRGGWPSKSLKAETAAAVADRLAALGSVLLLGAASDADYMGAVRSTMRSTPIDHRPGPLRESLRTLLAASFVVTVDTWALHAAAAARIPVFAILGPTRVFPFGTEPGCAGAIAPAAVPTWRPDDDRSIDEISAGEIVDAAMRFHTGETPRPAAAVVWSCDSEYALPSRPIAGGARPAFAWARAMAFRDLVAKYHLKLPLPAWRQATELRMLYSDVEKAKSVAAAEWAARPELFPLFETTFPHEDPDRIQREWIRATKDYLAAL